MQTGSLTIKQQIAEAQQRLAALKQEAQLQLGEEKGNIIINGVRKTPYTFTKDQAIKIRDIFNSPAFVAFLAENQTKLAQTE